MNSRELNKRITIQQKTVTKVEGIPSETWSDFVTVWASVESIAGREFFQAAAVNADITTRIKIRYLIGVTSAMRIVLGTRIFIIVAPPVDTNEKHEELQLMCKEVIPGGG